MLEHDVSEEYASEYTRFEQLVATKSRGESNGNDFYAGGNVSKEMMG